jgi:class 3 adenylate cyclase/SAM-dependent methyltransferase
MQPERSIATILFTDIVGSTERAAELGDLGWRDLLAEHHELVRQALRRYDGREIATAGDGFLAIFDSPDLTIRCACAIRDAVRQIGLEVRCGVHMGEVERTSENDISGIAVHVGSRVAAQARAGEVLVSGGVRDAELGSGFEFEDRGSNELKGVPGQWALYAVVSLPREVGEAAGRMAQVPPLGPVERSIAELPFESRSSEPETEDFNDGHSGLYRMARAYDIAFDFRNIPAECDSLLDVYKRYAGHTATSFLELAAGPGLHSIEMARRGLVSAALDLSSAMARYGLSKAERAGVDVDYRQGDMVDFAWDRSFDLVAILMDSFSYLLTNERVLQHLKSVAACMNPQGIYVQEMAHPRDVLRVGTSTGRDWQMEKDGMKVRMEWGQEDDAFDPVTQISETTVVMQIEEDGERVELVDKAPQRCFTATEWEALVLASPHFDLVEQLGALDMSTPFSNDIRAWRMVSVLQKRV